ncbi:universal stress family protein [Asticcacaulis biprosthecium C19]|uniref:Universal stress family protein n=1 Tax=Asticcacaulis biprosthecium C19 TaxID=715226 RepID=F4QTF5_9CAUL|nr:universal stress protein [Asticcacaulis biprosthecium]EGF90025.1 universal stress family protein [Asticcacaulis biprosthecium C19]
MSIKSLLLVFDGYNHDLPALNQALSLTQHSRSHLRVVHFAEPPILPETLGLGLYAGAIADGPVIDLLEATSRELTDTARAHTGSQCVHHGVPLLSDGEPGVMGQAAATFRVVVGTAADALAREALVTDLVILSWDNQPHGNFAGVLTALFGADQPVLLLPRHSAVTGYADGFARTVVFGWDGSRASAQALREAVPHMLHADEVFLLRIAPQRQDADLVSEEDLLAYLHSHSVSADFVRAERGTRTIGQALLEEAQRLGADLLAMGAYGHGHLSEMILGGVTDHVLKHGSLPLLLAH